MSADGKIADRNRSAARFSSPEDIAHLETQVAKADAVLFGAGTLRAYGTCLSVRQPSLIEQRRTHKQNDQPIQIVCSRSGVFDPTLRFFRQIVPRWLLTTQQGAKSWAGQDLFERILCVPADPDDWPAILATLAANGIRNLAVLGGGTLVANLVQQDLVDELYLTVCPVLLGGRMAPTPCDGIGLNTDLALRLELIEAETRGNEVFLHYHRCHLKKD